MTSWRHPLIAPVFRDSTAPVIQDGVVFTKSDQVLIPPSLRESAALLVQFEAAVENDESLPFVSFEDLLSLDEGFETESRISSFKLEATTSNGSIITQPTSPLRPTFQPYTSTPVSSLRNSTRSYQTNHNDSQHGPNQEVYSQNPSFILDIDNAELNLGILQDPTEDFYGLMAVENQVESTAGDKTDAEGENDDGDGLPPLWVEPTWPAWQDFPSNSSASLARIGMELDQAVSNTAVQQQESAPDIAETEIDENAAADSLLNLQSSPLKTESSQTQSIGNDTSNMPPPPPNQSTQPEWMDGINDMIADFSSRPAFKHSKSMSASARQPFLNRPGHIQRSLSNTTLLLDDPFILEPASASKMHKHGSAQELESPSFSQTKARSKSKSYSYRSHPSPSPLLERKREPLVPMHSNLSNPTRASPFRLNPSDTHHPGMPINTDSDSKDQASSSKPQDGMFDTPIRPSRTNPPSSVGQWLRFSSPVDPAASLGLVPMHAVPTTPGLRMIIGQDTPLGPGAGLSGKTRKQSATPRQVR